MGLERTALEHACNVIRRQIQDEVKDLTLFFVVHDDRDRSETLGREEQLILDHPAGEIAFPIFQKHKQSNRTEFLGLAIGHQKKKLSLKKHPFFLGLYFVNASDYETMEEAREHIYHLAWHAIELLDHYKAENKSYELTDSIITPLRNPVSLSKSNMAADVFAAVTLQLQGNNDMIGSLAYKRAHSTLSPTPYYKAEQYPYIIAIETTQQIFDELKENFNAKIRVSGHAIKVAREVYETYNDQPIKQWWSFCIRAQEMAWMGRNPKEILTAALYASEDPYTRSIAYLIAEALNIDLQTLSAVSFYNPFTDQEANERLHNKTCEESFQAALSQAMTTNSYYAFIQEAHAQNRKLAEGYPIGWCAHAILKAAAAHKNADPESPETRDLITKIFQEAQKEIPWKIMKQVNRQLMKKRRQGYQINTEKLEQMSSKFSSLSIFAHTFKTATRLYKRAEKKGLFDRSGIDISDFTLPGDIEKDDMTRYGAAFRNPDEIQKTEDA
ncbi:MAG: hypothetical protein DHS20C02_10190 [Micavibrio sp.]|nr:MAG: hypothetical protein DHS20C02_10190 [Micavibrio sp.]